MENKVNLNSIGMPKSGMPWKKNRKRPAIDKAISKQRYEEQMKLKKERKQMNEQINKLKEQKKEANELRKKQRMEQVKMKKLNEIKSSTYQEITNTKKLKKWSMKAKSQLMKLPKEVFYANLK